MYILRQMNWSVIALVIALALMAGGFERALATSLTITNSDFESNDPLADGKWYVPTISGWTISGEGGTFFADKSGSYSATPSSRVAYSNGGSISQTFGLLGDPLEDPLRVLNANHLYTLTVNVGNRNENWTKRGSFPGYSIELLAGGDVLGANTVTLPTPEYGYFDTAILTYQALADDPLLGQPLGIRLISNGIQVNWDNVRLTNCDTCGQTAVPEPATLLLLGSGLLGVVWFARKDLRLRSLKL